MSARDGGPAFPRIDGIEPMEYGNAHSVITEGGMTLREWYAGQALIGAMATMAHPQHDGLWDPTEVAEAAYELADAMLEVGSR